MIKISNLIYYFYTFIVSCVLTHNGHGATDLVWWVCIIGLIVAHMCGYVDGKE